MTPCRARAQDDQQAPVDPTAANPNHEHDIVVQGLRVQSLATKLEAPILNLPESVVVIPHDLILTQAANSVEDLVTNTVGVQAAQPVRGLENGFFIRGFVGSPVLVDGFNAGYGDGASASIINIANVETVEVLKGPPSVLYGQGNPGGVVTITSKVPKQTFGATFDAKYGSYNERKVDADVTGPIAGGLGFRMVASYENSDSYRRTVYKKDLFLAPTLAWQIDDATLASASYQREKLKEPSDRGFGFIGGPIIDEASVRTFLGEPSALPRDLLTQTIEAKIERKLGDRFTVRAAYFRFQFHDPHFQDVDLNDYVTDTIVSRVVAQQDRRASDQTFSLQLTGKFDTAFLSHSIFASVDRTNFRDVSLSSRGPDRGTIDPISFVDPVYTGFDDSGIVPYDMFTEKIRTTAVYLQDLVSIGSHIKLLAGVRHDQIREDSIDIDPSDPTSRSDEVDRNKVWTPRVGVVVKPSDSSSIYASFGKNFLPNAGDGLTRLGTTFAPERSKVYEVGAKQELFEKRLNVTLALYRIEKSHILVVDPVDSDFSVDAGDARSQGIEAELSARPAAGWDLRAGISRLSTRVTHSSDPSFPVGDSLVGASKTTAQFFTSYRMNSVFSGLQVFGGVYYASSAPAAYPNGGPRLPCYTKLDLGATAYFDHFSIQLNAKNLTNSRILQSNGFGRVFPAAPRILEVSLRVPFGSLK